jgi:hypothetical protein
LSLGNDWDAQHLGLSQLGRAQHVISRNDVIRIVAHRAGDVVASCLQNVHNFLAWTRERSGQDECLANHSFFFRDGGDDLNL